MKETAIRYLYNRDERRKMAAVSQPRGELQAVSFAATAPFLTSAISSDEAGAGEIHADRLLAHRTHKLPHDPHNDFRPKLAAVEWLLRRAHTASRRQFLPPPWPPFSTSAFSNDGGGGEKNIQPDCWRTEPIWKPMLSKTNSEAKLATVKWPLCRSHTASYRQY